MLKLEAREPSSPTLPTHRRRPACDTELHYPTAMRVISAYLVSLAASTIAAAVLWFVANPGRDRFVRPKELFPSDHPTSSFPYLTHDRERLLLTLVALTAGGALALAHPVRHALAHLSDRAVARVLIVSQIALGSAALIALSEHERGGGFELARWGPSRTVSALGVAALFGWAARLVLRHPDIDKLRRAGKTLVTAAAVALGTALTLTIAEAPNSVRDIYDTAWVINDLLAPSNGLHPLAGYSASYSNLLGEVLVPFIRLGIDPVWVVMGFLLLATATVLGLVTCVFHMIGMRWPVAALGTALATIAAVGNGVSPFLVSVVDTRSGRMIVGLNAFSYHAVMPIRMLGPIILGAVVVAVARRPARRSALLVGVLAGVVACNNFDFGGGAAIAAGAALLVAAFLTGPSGQLRRHLTAFVAGLAVGIAAVTAFVFVVARRAPDLPAATFYARLYGAGRIIGLPVGHLWDVHVAVIGTFVVAIVLAVACTAAAVRGRVGLISDPSPLDPIRRAENGALLGALMYFGILGLVVVVYFFNRPIAPTLIGSCYLLWGIALILLSWAALRTPHSLRRLLLPGSATIAIILTTVLVGVRLPTALQTDVALLSQGAKNGTGLVLDPAYSRADQVTFITTHSPPNGRALILGTWANSLALEAGIRNLTPMSADRLTTNRELARVLAVRDRGHRPDIYITSDGNHPEVAAALSAAGYVEVARSAYFVLMRVPHS